MDTVVQRIENLNENAGIDRHHLWLETSPARVVKEPELFHFVPQDREDPLPSVETIEKSRISSREGLCKHFRARALIDLAGGQPGVSQYRVSIAQFDEMSFQGSGIFIEFGQ